MTNPPVALFARPVGSPLDTEQRRLVIRADDMDRFDSLPTGVEASEETPVTLLADESITVLDLVTDEKVVIRRATCGLPLCACAAEWWPVGLFEVPPPTMYDDLALYWDPADGE